MVCTSSPRSSASTLVAVALAASTLAAATLAGCAYHPPMETPALVAAEGPVRTLPLPAGEPVRLALRAGSAHDPPGREGLAWVTAHAVAAAAGATVEVGPEVVVFSVPPEGALALASLIATPPSAQQVATARADAAAAIAALDCRAIAERAWDAWIYAGHPYGHAPEGRLSVLPTLTAAEVAAFQEVRYVRSVAVLGIPEGVQLDPAQFVTLPPRLSASPVPAIALDLPTEKALVVHAPDQRCVVAGHPAMPDGADAVASAALAPGDVVMSARRQPRRLASLPLPPEREPASLLTDLQSGGWLPIWQASRVLAPEATIPAARALADDLLALHPWPSLARPLTIAAGARASDVVTPAPAPPALDATLAVWLTAGDLRAVVVLPADAPFGAESPAGTVVQPAVTTLELFR